MSEVHLGCPPNLSRPQISRVIFSLPPVEPVDKKYMDAFKDEATSTHQVVSLDKDGGSKPTLFVKLYLLPIVVHLGDPWVGYDQSSNFNHSEYTSTSHVSFSLMEKTSTPFYCEEFTPLFEFGHDREACVVKNVDITSGEVTLIFLKKKGSFDAFSHAAAEVVESSVESSPAKKPHKKNNQHFCL